MSINQMKRFLRPYPRVANLRASNHEDMYFFVYDHFLNWHIFMSRLPGAMLVGLGQLENWTFHINQKGNPNIRSAFMNGMRANLLTEQFVAPAPAVQITTLSSPVTYGWVFHISQRGDRVLHDILCDGDRIRLVHPVHTIISFEPARSIIANCIMYWDPRNTCDLRHSIIDNQADRARWLQGIQMLRLAGMSQMAGVKIWNHLIGLTEDVEPLLVCPKLLVRTAEDSRLELIEDEVIPVQNVGDRGEARDDEPQAPRISAIVHKKKNKYCKNTMLAVVKGAAIKDDKAVIVIPNDRQFSLNFVGQQPPRPPIGSNPVKAVARGRRPVTSDTGGARKAKKRKLGPGATSTGPRDHGYDDSNDYRRILNGEIVDND